MKQLMETAPDLSPETLEALCVRMTGRTVAEWEAVWRGRRVQHLRDHRLNGNKEYSLKEREDAIRYYDLDDEDFESIDGMNTRYRITQSALSRIAAEAYKRDAA